MEGLQTRINRRHLAIISSSFLVTFVIARLFVYLILGHLLPNFFLTIKGVHIHHYTYGVFILAIVGLVIILKHPDPDSRFFNRLTWFYGIGLGLTFDEFGMWIRLEDDYWVRQSYDAVIIIILLFLNIAFLKPIAKWLSEEIKDIF